jgi:hypothetical protein
MTPAAEFGRHPANDNSPYFSYRPPLQSLPPHRAEGVLRLRRWFLGARGLRGSGSMAPGSLP